MKKLILHATILAALLAFPLMGAHAEDAETPDSQRELEAMFKGADIIPDGKLDSGEFDIYHYTAFNLMDTDEDGALVKDECMTDCFSYQVWTGRDGEKAKPHRRHEFSDTPYRFEAMDIDGNGVLNVYEYILFGRDRFEYFDQDKDAFIAKDEFCNGYRSSMPCDFAEGAQNQ